jgi:hypothetical protein
LNEQSSTTTVGANPFGEGLSVMQQQRALIVDDEELIADGLMKIFGKAGSALVMPTQPKMLGRKPLSVQGTPSVSWWSWRVLTRSLDRPAAQCYGQGQRVADPELAISVSQSLLPWESFSC